MKKKITFRDLSEYENVDFQGFRGDIYVKKRLFLKVHQSFRRVSF